MKNLKFKKFGKIGLGTFNIVSDIELPDNVREKIADSIVKKLEAYKNFEDGIIVDFYDYHAGKCYEKEQTDEELDEDVKKAKKIRDIPFKFIRRKGLKKEFDKYHTKERKKINF